MTSYRNKIALGAALAALSALSSGALAKESEGFYTIIDGSGQLISIPRSSSHADEKKSRGENKKAVQQKQNSSQSNQSFTSVEPQRKDHANGAKIDSNAMAPKVDDRLTSKNAVTTDKALKAQAPSVNSDNGSEEEQVEFNSEAYFDSEYLIQKDFNPEDRMRFYSVPGAGRFDVIEQRGGLNLNQQSVAVPDQIRDVMLSDQYRPIIRQIIEQALPEPCILQSDLKMADKPGRNNRVNLWPKSRDQAFPFELLTLDQARYVKLYSYASSQSNPSYYWPLPVFLNEQGCAIEAVQGYFVGRENESFFTKSALIGNLLVPENASYLLLTPLRQSADVSEYSLAPLGELKLEVIR